LTINFSDFNARETLREVSREKLPFAGYSACHAEAHGAKADSLFEIVWDD
jgi:hypothetical protein